MGTGFYPTIGVLILYEYHYNISPFLSQRCFSLTLKHFLHFKLILVLIVYERMLHGLPANAPVM